MPVFSRLGPYHYSQVLHRACGSAVHLLICDYSHMVVAMCVHCARWWSVNQEDGNTEEWVSASEGEEA